MIKNFKDLNDKEKKILQNNRVVVSEMIDGLRFKIMFSDSGYVLKTAKGKVIDEIDCIVNSFYKELMDYMRSVVTKTRLVNVLKHFGPCEAQFIYVPKRTYNMVSYNNYQKKRVVFCYLYTQDKSKLDPLNFYHLFDDVVENVPVVAVHPNGIESYSVNDLCQGKTFTGNSTDNIEALILESGKVKCKVVVNDTTTSIDPTTKKIYRDTVIEDFAKVMSDVNLDEMCAPEESYVDCICNLFYDYVNRTDIQSKLYIDPEDLLPPSVNNVGDIDLDVLPPTAKIICSNKLHMNVLRLLLVTFNTENVHKFDTFSEPVKKSLYRIFYKINNE